MNIRFAPSRVFSAFLSLGLCVCLFLNRPIDAAPAAGKKIAHLCALEIPPDCDGPYIEKFPNGKIKRSGLCRAGKMVGLWKFYYPNGALWATVPLKDCKYNGLWLEWYTNGVKKSEGVYADGFADGVWKTWHPNGRLASRILYQDWLKTGAWVFWDSAGKLVKKCVYKKNDLVECRDPKGKIVDE